jgi:hypothetical protein
MKENTNLSIIRFIMFLCSVLLGMSHVCLTSHNIFRVDFIGSHRH